VARLCCAWGKFCSAALWNQKKSLLVILGDPFTALIQNPKIELGTGDALLGGAPEPFGGFRGRFLPKLIRQMQHAEVVLRFWISRPCLYDDFPGLVRQVRGQFVRLLCYRCRG